MDARPLADITLVDASQGVAGPTAGVIFADLGADVIAVEPPGGKTARHYRGGIPMPNVARNKRSVVLDLKTPEGVAALHDLVEDADAFIHNNRPEKNAELGCDYGTLADINPQLVYCSVTGYGEAGLYSDRPAVDPLAQAISGMMWSTGEPDRTPSRISVSVADYATGIYAAFAMLTAIRHARRTGQGQKVETSLFDTAAGFMGHWYTLYDKTGEQPHRQGDSWDTYAPAGIFETATGPIYLATPFQFLWERVPEAIDRPDLLEDPRFASNEKRLEHRDVLTEELESAFVEYDREELLERLLAADVPASELKTVAEATHDEHLHERGTLKRIEDVDGKEVIATISPVRYSKTPVEVEHGPPQVGEHTHEVLSEHGLSEEEIDRLLESDD
ncbi:CaiB/BaiF CoA transferase family protein [Haloterrigena alkaliphila]|uniref:CaiB/BaiF CoA transferase family protein n=1 Tax=Haloterrigena alkaliphila TaxID=2816475 RepID=UPI001CFFD5D3|nr:CoA transferase [Haloterrigena alkaliphila]UHQ95241.1 CoA transferase [Haloterrigena alkaliphila]